MYQKADPLESATVRKLVKKGIHLVCVFSTYCTLRDGPVTVARSKPQWLIFLAYFYFSMYVEFVLGFVIF